MSDLYVRITRVAHYPVRESIREAIASAQTLDSEGCLEFEQYIDIVDENDEVVDGLA